MGDYVGLYMEAEKAELYRKKGKKNYLRKDSLKIKEVKEGIILPAKEDKKKEKLWCIGGVVDKLGEFVEESITENVNLFGGIYDFDEKNIIASNETVVFMGPFLSHWGHFICDQISRLWYVLDNPKKYKIAYCGWNWGSENTDVWGNYLEFFELLGIPKENLINVKKPTKYKEVIIPEISFYMNKYYTIEFKNIFKKIVSNVKLEQNIEKYDLIFYSRGKFDFAKGRERGEKTFEKIFEKNGYKIIEPELLTLSQQIYYLQNCKKMVATSGSITHNLLFAQKEIEVTILNKMYLMNNYQMVIDNMSNAKITCVDVYANIFPVCFGLGPFYMRLNKNFYKFCRKNSIRLSTLDKFNIFSDISNFIWYINKYFSIYSNADNMAILKSQIKSRKALKIREQEEFGGK
ncbi:MAG: glycosyltransferase family 61 protein [Lachnospiraceae bacterium]|nr:glycosyltransferase family 61 protein [Lachnospiraceae bacterium]